MPLKLEVKQREIVCFDCVMKINVNSTLILVLLEAGLGIYDFGKVTYCGPWM
jgi:hypothetical protein